MANRLSGEIVSVKTASTEHARGSSARGSRRIAAATALAVAVLATASCKDIDQPAYRSVVTLRGDAYERGVQHGEKLHSEIRSLYTMLLESSLLPYLNREQSNVASVLLSYLGAAYGEGEFSYKVFLEAGQNLLPDLEACCPAVVREMEGVADGADLPFETILVLNTFADTLMALRSVTLFIHQMNSPRLVDVSFSSDLGGDGVDNNGDGAIDDSEDNVVKDPDADATWLGHYGPTMQAAMVEVPVDATLRFVLNDPPGLATKDRRGVDPATIRVQLGTEVYEGDDPSIATAVQGDEDEELVVTFTPPGDLPAAAIVPVIIDAGNYTITSQLPAHAQFMRSERFVFTTTGYGKETHEVANLGADDGRSQPPALAFAVRDSATAAGDPYLGHHFALLDSNTLHKHTVIFVVDPDEGIAHTYASWAGLVWGFSGMNAEGLTYAANYSDSLDNPLVKEVQEHTLAAKLLLSGVTIGFKGRQILTEATTVAEASALIAGTGNTFGWNVLLADRAGGLAALELDANVLDEADGGVLTYDPDSSDPENLDPFGLAYASVGADDLRIAAHFEKNVDDIETSVLEFDVRAQRYWSGFFYRSVRAHSLLGDAIAARYGDIDADGMIEILRLAPLVDTRDSMNAIVYSPADLTMRAAMGQVPATDGEFIEYDLSSLLAGEGN